MSKRSSGSTGSAGAGRPSLVPQRVQKSRDSTGKSSMMRLSSGSRSSVGGRSSFSGRNSYASTGRPSLLGKKPLGAANTTVSGLPKKSRYSSSKSYGHALKDPRPNTDRGYKDQCVKNLIEFLIANGYSHPISPKILHSPQTKDFVRIFEFLMTIVVRHYRVTSKMEEEIPKMLRLLGYPFTISKSAMYSVGSPHTWPTLLAALTWLKTKIEYALDTVAEIHIMFPMEDDFEGISEAKLKFDHCEETYKRFMEFSDDYTDLEEKLAKQIKQNGVGGEVEHLGVQNRQKQEELDMLQQQPDQLMNLKEQLSSMQLDKQKLVTYLEELEQHQRKVEMKLTMAEEENSNMEAELEGLAADTAKKQRIYETQEFSQEDIQRVKMERQGLQKQTENVEQENQELDNHKWQTEMRLGKMHDKTAGTLSEYNRVGRSLHLIPLDAENAFNIDYELKAAFSEQQLDRCNSIAKPALMQIKQESAQRVMEAVECRTNEQEALEHYNDMCQEKDEVVKSLELTLKRTEGDVQSRKEMKQREVNQLQTTVDSLHREIQDLHQSAEMGLHQLGRQVNDDALKVDEKQAARKREQQKMGDFLLQACGVIADHKYEIQQHVRGLAVEAEKRAERIVAKYS